MTVTAANSAPLLPGGTVQLTARALTSAGVELTTTSITWSSASATVATVSAAGLVTAVGAGTTTISATAGSVSGTASVHRPRSLQYKRDVFSPNYRIAALLGHQQSGLCLLY